LRDEIDLIDFGKATATIPEDREAIMKAVMDEGGYDKINEHLKRCIRDRAAICEMALSDVTGEVCDSAEEFEKIRKKVADSTQNQNGKALDMLLSRRADLKLELEEAEKNDDTEEADSIKQVLRTMELDEAALHKEKHLLMKMSEDMARILEKDDTHSVIKGVTSEVLSVLVPMLEQQHNQSVAESRRTARDMKTTLRRTATNASLTVDPISPSAAAVLANSCPSGCGCQVTWHETHCCALCLETEGKHHGERCDQRPLNEMSPRKVTFDAGGLPPPPTLQRAETAD